MRLTFEAEVIAREVRMIELVHDLNFLADIFFQISFLLEGCLADGFGCEVVARIVFNEENFPE